MSNIQIFGKAKCFATKKAQRYFKERRISFQAVDLEKKGMSRGELRSIMGAVGGLGSLVDGKNKDVVILHYLAYEDDKLEKLLEHPQWLQTPVVRYGHRATVGYCPEIWEQWIK